MDFILAKTLKQIFQVKGRFYRWEAENRIYDCRSLVRIERVDSNTSYLDALIIMMNPGSSSPRDAEVSLPIIHTGNLPEINEVDLIDTKPDGTQYQVMRLMLYMNWNCIEVVNLSDVCCGNSASFRKMMLELKEDESVGNHSILHHNRNNEFTSILSRNKGPTITAWGDVPYLQGTIDALKKWELSWIGVAREGDMYYHASPLLKSAKLEWLKKMVYVLKA